MVAVRGLLKKNTLLIDHNRLFVMHWCKLFVHLYSLFSNWFTLSFLFIKSYFLIFAFDTVDVNIHDKVESNNIGIH